MKDCPACLSPMRPDTVKHSCGAIINKEKAFELGLLSREQAVMFGFIKENAVQGNPNDIRREHTK